MSDFRPVIDIDQRVGPALDLLKTYAWKDLLTRWSESTPSTTIRPDDDEHDRETNRILDMAVIVCLPTEMSA